MSALLLRLLASEPKSLLRYVALTALLVVAFSVVLIVISRFVAAPDVGPTKREENAFANGVGG